MPNGSNYTSFILQERDKIEDFIGKMSSQMLDYMDQHKTSTFTLFYKHLTHSDLATFGKATHPDSHAKNLLYYMKTDEMLKVEEQTKKPFQTAHQSCIGLKKEFYDLIGLPDPRNVPPYLINDYMDVFLVNSNMQYFKSEYTQKVFTKLGKIINPNSRDQWNFKHLDVSLSPGDFTPLQLHVAVHGLGMSVDSEFHKIRHHLFKGDTLLLLCENTGLQRKLFVLFEKNPLFFPLIGEANETYVKYQERMRRRLISRILAKDNAASQEDIETEVTRQEQSAWRAMLADEMMAYTQDPRQVFCPLTYIQVDFDQLGALFVASHIKGFSDPNTTNEEKYDINNGLLICANADALFDKHLITIDENKQLVFSFLLDSDIRLKSQLLLMQPIFTPILNEERMKYLAYHRSVFQQKEAERRAA